jgi:hypothetical protein
MDKKLKLNLNEEEDLPKLPELKVSDLKLNLNGKKHKHGKNTYKRRMGQFRRTLRW